MSLTMSVSQPFEHIFHQDPKQCIDNVDHDTTNMPTNPLKRPLSGKYVQALPDTSMKKPQNSSPAPSADSSLTALSATPAPANPDGSSNSTQPPAKRRKLTPSEKAAVEREKEEKRVKREEDKARREVEKQKKDEERRQKNELLEEKKREKDLKRHEKEEARKQEEEERAKKERAQSRIKNFFGMPKSSAKPRRSPQPESTHVSAPGTPRAGREVDGADNQSTPSKLARTVSDYQRTFLQFAAPSNSVVAGPNYFTWDQAYTQKALRDADTWFAPGGTSRNKQTLAKCLDLSSFEAPDRGWVSDTVSKLVTRIDGSTPGVTDRTSESSTKPMDARAKLQEHPMKYIFFHQDVRPPYIGTLSSIRARSDALRLARRPCKKSREEVDYEYDSEAEWDEPEEGEDLGSEGEDDDDSIADGEELEEFLDDEGADGVSKPRKHMLSGDMLPVSTGLCWENDAQKLVTSVQGLAINPSDYRMEVLSDTMDFPIDPFSSAYWPDESHQPDTHLAAPVDPTRLPLLPRANIPTNGATPQATADTPKPVKPPKAPKQVRLLAGQELEEFKQVVQGSDLTKQGLLAVVKKKLPKVPNAVLSDTLSTVAARVGAKEADKRWVIIPGQ